ncbi:unnamed protein product [Cochlearia groenlandica]
MDDGKDTIITELSPNCHEVVESNNITISNSNDASFVGETTGTIEENNGTMVVYEGGKPISTSENGSKQKSCFEKSSWQTIYEELVGTSHESNLELLQIIQQHIPMLANDPSLETPIFDDSVEEDGLVTNTVMGSALGMVEKLIAQEFDPVEQLVWGSPYGDETM